LPVLASAAGKLAFVKCGAFRYGLFMKWPPAWTVLFTQRNLLLHYAIIPPFSCLPHWRRAHLIYQAHDACLQT